jgi:hypothetical protein
MLLCVVFFCAVKINSPANHLNADDKADSGHSKTRIQLLLSTRCCHSGIKKATSNDAAFL